MAELGISAEDLKRLARLVDENNLSELRYQEGEFRVTIRTVSYQRPSVSTSFVTTGGPVAPGEGVAYGYEAGDEGPNIPAEALGADLLRIEAPIMGVFYRSSAPGDPFFIEVGDTVEVGQVVGIIEAMKVFSEVPSEVAGRVREIPAKNGGLVQPGDALVLLEAV